MADTIYIVNCGFFDAVNSDRTYTAEDMNKPYARLVADGVFATPQGTASDDLQTLGSGAMKVTVKAGRGVFASKWFENPSAILFDVPSNTSFNARVDSIIAQVDTRQAGRVGNIVYRTGTPAATPEPPAINETTGVTEYRLANIAVASGATAITDAEITDLRGSSSCPWVTGLIKQVDTSTLWAQFQSAYKAQFEQYGIDYQQYIAIQRQAWEDFLETLTEELTVATNVITYTSTYTAGGTATNIPINIASYNADTDVLLVYINGLLANGKYTLNADKISIDLNNAISAGNTVYFVVFHSVVAADIESTISMIQTLDAKLDAFMNDTGWVNLSLENGATAFDASNVPAFRKIGDTVYLRGAIKGLTTLGAVIATLPVECSPGQDHYFTTVTKDGTSVTGTVTICVNTAGQVVLAASAAALDATDMLPLSAQYLAE